MSWNLTFEWLESLAAQQLLGVAMASTVLCLAGLLAGRFARGQSAAVRFCIWQMVGCGIVASAAILSLVPGVPLRSAPSPASATIEPRPLPFYAAAPVARVAAPTVSTSPIDTAPATQEPRLRHADSEFSIAQSPQPLQVTTDQPAPATVNWFPSVLVLGIAIWGLFALLQLSWFMRSVAICYGIARRASTKLPDSAAGALQRAKGRIGIRTGVHIDLCVSDAVSVPFAIGIFRPAIVLPAACDTWTTAKLEFVLAHELSHIQRRDILWHWSGKLACFIAWFNPLVWLAVQRAIFERERACDDRVIDSGIDAVDYGRSLVEIAAAMCGRSSLLAASVSMAEPPLKQRLHWILSTNCDRRKVSKKAYCMTAVLFIALAGLLGVIRPLATATVASEQTTQEAPVQHDSVGQASTQNANADTVQLPTSVTGYVTDMDAQPIAGAKVEVRLVDFGVSQRRRDAKEVIIHRWTVTTDAQGVYRLDPSSLGEVPGHYRFGAACVWADGFATGSGRYWPTAEEVADGTEIEAAKLQKGCKVVGLVCNASGEPTSAIIKGAAALDDSGDMWLLEGEEVTKDGKFELWVPDSEDIELIVYASGHAPKRVALASDRLDAGKITLSLGTRVTGQLLDRRSQAVADAVIAMDTHDVGDLDGIALGASFAVLTDQAGRFELPPAAGRCRIWTALSASRSDGLGNETVTGVRPPLVVPVVLTLSNDGGSQEEILREAEKQVVTGTVRWEDGDPVAGFEISGGAMGIDDLTYAQTDATGRYRIELPRPLKEAYLNAFGERDGDGVWHMAFGQAAPPGRGSGQFISFDFLDGDVSGADWELRRYRTPFPVSAEQRQADRAFAKLTTLEQEAAEAYTAAMEKALTPEEQSRVYTDLDPRNAMASHYLAFEREHRGDKVAMQAVCKILQGANSVGDPETKVAKARNEAVDRLIDHYLGHEDLATAFRSLDAGPDVPRADTLLLLASERSPHRQVRAAALLARAERAKVELRYAQMLPELEEFVTEFLREDPPPPAVQAEVTRRIEELRSLDHGALRGQANTWLDTIVNDYAEIIKPHDPSRVTYGTAGTDLKFAINHVVVGEPAPELSAKDVEGEPFRLSDLRGQVVVLTFGQNILDSAGGLPNQDIAREFSSRPLKLVTIMGTPDEDKFSAALDGENYAGTIIWEPLNGPLQSKWGLDNYATTFVIDQSGTLVIVEVVPEKLSGRLKKLLD